MSTDPLLQIEGKYEILHKIKEGGMGAIYKVRHRLLDEIRVIKVIRTQMADSEDMQRRFATEAKAATRLKHPNIAQLYDFSVDAGGAYIVMEFIDGVTLQEMLAKSGPRPLDLTLEIARQGLRALRYLHQQGYVHRDIAPDNLMLTKDHDDRPLVKLIDLGIVKHVDTREGITKSGMFLGKVRYSSPEQFSADKAGIDSRSDIYSYGVMLYELLTGTSPVVGDDLSQLVAAHLFRPPLSFDETDPQGRVPAEIRDVVMHALQKQPEKRVATAEEFLERLSLRPVPDSIARDLEHTLSITLNRVGDEQARPGTTQGKLDANFGLVRTPGHSGLRVADRIAAAGEPDLPGLVTTAKMLAREGRWEEARRRLYQALALEPDHTEARSLLSSVETSLQQAIEEEKRRQQAIALAGERIEACLRADRADEASRILADVRREVGEDFQLVPFDTRISHLRGVLAERARQNAIVQALRTIEEALGAERIDQARKLLAKGRAELGTDPRLVEIEGSIDRVEAAVAARRREEAISSSCAAIAVLIAGERSDDAARSLAAARASYGDDERLAALETKLTELRARIEEERRRAESAERSRRASALLADAAKLAERREWAAAAARAAEALALDPQSAPAREQLVAWRQEEVRERERLVVAKAREQALVRVESEVRGRVAAEDFAAAEKLLDEARRAHGEDARLTALTQRIREARDAVTERERHAAVSKVAEEVERLTREQKLDAAADVLSRALRRLGSDPRFAQLAIEIEQARSRAELERQRVRSKEVEAAVAAIESQLAAEELEPAQRAVESAEKRLGRDARFEQARGRIERARAQRAARLAQQEAERRAEEQARQRRDEEDTRRRRAAALLEAAATQAERGDLAGALEQASEAQAIDPDAARSRQAVDRYTLALEAEARDRRLQAILTASRTDLEQDRLEDALARLESATAEHGGIAVGAEDGAAAELRRLIAETRAELERRDQERVRQQAVAAEAAAIAALLEKGKLERVARGLDAAEERFGDSASFSELRRRLDAARRAEAHEKAEKLVAQAHAKANSGKIEEATKLCERGLELEPDHAGARSFLVDLERQRQLRAAPRAAAPLAGGDAIPAMPALAAPQERPFARRPVIWVAAGAVVLAVVSGLAIVLRSGDQTAEVAVEVAEGGPQIDEASSDATRKLEPPPITAPVTDANPKASSDPSAGQAARDSVAVADDANTGSPPASSRRERAEPRVEDDKPAAGPSVLSPSTGAAEPAGKSGRDTVARAPVPLPVEPITSAKPAAPKQPPAGADKVATEAEPGTVAGVDSVQQPPARAVEPEPVAREPVASDRTAGAEPSTSQSKAAFRRGDLIGEGDTDVVPPILRSVPEARMPPLAERQRREAVILVRVLVDENGNVASAEIQDTDQSRKMFHPEAVRTAKRARFEPGTKDGVPGKMYQTLPIRFRAGS